MDAVKQSFRKVLRGVSGLCRPSLLRHDETPHVGTRWQPKTSKSTGPVCRRLSNPSAGVLFLQQAADNGGGHPTQELILQIHKDYSYSVCYKSSLYCFPDSLLIRTRSRRCCYRKNNFKSIVLLLCSGAVLTSRLAKKVNASITVYLF